MIMVVSKSTHVKCCHVLYSNYYIVVDEENQQRRRRQASSDCYAVIKILDYPAKAFLEITHKQLRSSTIGSIFVLQCI